MVQLIKNIVNIYPDIEEKLNKVINDVQIINYQADNAKEKKIEKCKM